MGSIPIDNSTLWQSLLFVPANVPKFVKSAAKLNVDAVILDLEDSISAHEKVHAREELSSAIDILKEAGIQQIIRVNNCDQLLEDDLEVAVRNDARFIMVPKTRAENDLTRIDALLNKIEERSNTAIGYTRLIALIETPDALPQLSEIATSSERLVALAFGPEDFSRECRIEPTPKNLFGPCQALIFAAHAKHLNAFGVAGSIAKFGENSGFEKLSIDAKQMGFDGVMCIHPSQVYNINSAFRFSKDEIEKAQSIVDAFEEAERNNIGSIQLYGQMIDLPVAQYYRNLLVLANHRKDKR